jgi:hypothetical protein
MSQCQSQVGTTYARAKAMKRERFGTRVTLTDAATGQPLRRRPYPAVVRKMEPRDRDYLPQGGANVAFADVRVYELSPGDFQARPSPIPPKEGDGLTEQGQAFTVIGVPPPDVIAGVPHTLVLICYRTPEPDESTVDAATGKRADYTAPDSTL